MELSGFTTQNIKVSLVEDERNYFEIILNKNFLNMFFLNLLLCKNPLPELNVKITEREKDILMHIANGEDNGEIAKKLYVSEHTIKTYISTIFRKLEVKDRTEAVVKAIRYGIIDIFS